MANFPTEPTAEGLAPGPRPFYGDKLAIWLCISVLLGTLMAWAALIARAYFAPWLFFPLMVGLVLGGLLVLGMRAAEVGHHPTLCFGAVLAAALTIAGEHYFTFVRARQLALRDPHKLAKLQLVAPERVPPATFAEFLRWSAGRGVSVSGQPLRAGWAWLYWALDGLLVLLPTVLLVAVTGRLPYCSRCRRWYRTIRSGRIESQTAARVATLLGIDWQREVGKAGCRLLACPAGCGPLGVVLCWSDRAGHDSSGIRWLDPARHRQLLAILDHPSPEPDPPAIERPP